MRIAIEDLRLDHLLIVCPCRASYEAAESISVCSIPDLQTRLAVIGK
jgi:hypothetical protein